MTREEYIELRNSRSVDLNRIVPQIHEYMKSKDTSVTVNDVVAYLQTKGLQDVVATLDDEFTVQRLCDKDGNELKVY